MRGPPVALFCGETVITVILGRAAPAGGSYTSLFLFLAKHLPSSAGPHPRPLLLVILDLGVRDVPVELLLPLAGEELRDLLDVLVTTARKALRNAAVNTSGTKFRGTLRRTMTMLASFGRVFAS